MLFDCLIGKASAPRRFCEKCLRNPKQYEVTNLSDRRKRIINPLGVRGEFKSAHFRDAERVGIALSTVHQGANEKSGLVEHFDRNVLGRHGWLDRVVLLIDYEGKLPLSRYHI
jgi:hypothetical protein